MDYPPEMKVFDLSHGYDPDYIRSFDWGIGKYNEKRRGMYTTDLYADGRNIHMGIDIWTKTGASVYAFDKGKVMYKQDRDQAGDYGPTIVTVHQIKGRALYALFGHLSKESLQQVTIGQSVVKGETIATIGSQMVNGGWAPHLHFQLTWDDPGEANMPGVVTEENREEALQKYPNPLMVLGNIM